MSIKYKVNRRKIGFGKDKNKVKFIAKNIKNDTINTDHLARYIQKISSLSKGDVVAVLYALNEIIPQFLRDGNVVDLVGLGNFKINIRSKTEQTAEEVTNKSIKNAKIVFTPHKEFKEVLEDLSFNKI